jgi:hypothetical protein
MRKNKGFAEECEEEGIYVVSCGVMMPEIENI